MYADHPKAKPPVPAAQLAMAKLLQTYEQKSDAGAMRKAMFDKRWQIVLNCLSEEGAPFSQKTRCYFRHQLITHNMNVTLLEHAIHIAFPFIEQGLHPNNYDFAAQYLAYGPRQRLIRRLTIQNL